MANPEDGASYPRDVPVEPGMPDGWKGIEKLYGPSSKYAGKVYCRYFSLDGKHRNVCSPKQVISIDCEAKGTDPAPIIAEYFRLQKERHEREAEARKVEREARGKLAGEARENAIARFRERFGSLCGPQVFCFPGWTTRWHYQPNCDQVMVEYIDTEGNSWKLLKDLECAFQFKMDQGHGEHIPGLVEDGKSRADPAVFSTGSKKARETGGVYEIAPGTGDSRVLSQEDRAAIRKEREEARKSEPGAKKQRLGRVSLKPEGLKQTGWAAMESREEVQQAFLQFRGLLERKGFESTVGLIAVYGVSLQRIYHRRLCGVYFQMPEPYGGQPCYQKLLHCPQVTDEVACDGVFVLWNGAQSRWEIATCIADVRPVVAHSAESSGPFAKAAGPWQVQDGNSDFQEDGGLVILEPGAGIKATG